MPQERLPAVFMRGGTSKAVMFRRDDLPPEQSQWDRIFLQVMGSPDSNGRQLDGMGGGLSSLSKVCIIGPPTRPDADVDYTFAQVSVRDAVVDYSGNCGNMSSAVGPFAVDEAMVNAAGEGPAIVRIHNTNTSKIIVSHFAVAGGLAVTAGDLRLDGIPGCGAPIRLEFLDPGGSRTGLLLPTGKALDVFDVPGLDRVEASAVDAANPCVFVAAEALGKSGSESPEELEADDVFLQRMEDLRRAASVAMGIAPDVDAAGLISGVPKVAIIAAPGLAMTLDGRSIAPDQMDLVVRMISVGQPHRAVPVTGALCLAIAARIAGSLPHTLTRPGVKSIRIAQPSGLTLVDAKVGIDSEGRPHAEHGAVYRTARRLFDGMVYYGGQDAEKP